MRFMGLDLNDEIVDQYFQHVRCGHRDENALRLEILSLLSSELGVKDLDEALSAYGKEECEAQIHKVLKEMIETFYRYEPVIIAGLKIDGKTVKNLFALYNTEYENKKDKEVLEITVKDIVKKYFHNMSVEEAVTSRGEKFVETLVNARLYELFRTLSDKKK